MLAYCFNWRPHGESNPGCRRERARIGAVFVGVFLVLQRAFVAGLAAFSVVLGCGAESEIAFSERWCATFGGQAEVVLAGGVRADCLLTSHAVEVERAVNWAEAVGQSLHYAMESERRAGIVLLLDRPADFRYWIRLASVVERWALPVDLLPIYRPTVGGGVR